MGTYDIERYLNVRSAYGASFGPDGDRLSVLLNTTGVAQVWTLDSPLSWPEQRTFADERVTFASWSPERPELVFGMDEGGNERAQLFRLDADDGTIENCTATPDAKHRWGGWSHDGERFAFASNRRDEAVFDVYVQGRAETGDEATLVHEGDGWLSVSGWSPDDSRLLVSRSHSSFDQDLYVLALRADDEGGADGVGDDGDGDGVGDDGPGDLAVGDVEHVTPHEGDVRFQSASWAPDGEGIYLVTDRDSDTLFLAYLDLETLDLEPVAGRGEDRTDGSEERIGEREEESTTGSEERTGDDDRTDDGDEEPGSVAGRISSSGGDWNVDGVAVDDETGRFVYSRNVDGYTDLTVGEFEDDDPTAFETFPDPDLAGDVSGGVSFDPDAERFAISTTGDAINTNVFVVDVETGAAERWTAAPTAGIPPETFRESDLVRIESGAGDWQRSSARATASSAGLEIPGFFTLPAEYDAGETPVIVDIHGGPESQRRPSFSSVKQYFLNRGYAYFEPNVRGSSGYGKAYASLDDVEKRMDSVADVAACVEWLHDHPAVDPDRIAAYGGSYGGFMVLAAMTEYPDLWAAGVDVVGIANFVTFLENTGDWRRELREAEYGSLDDDREFLESISPINHAEKIDAPLFVLHGENDPRVPVGEAERIVEEVREQGVPVRKLIFEDEGHGFSKLENRVEAYSAIADFLAEHV